MSHPSDVAKFILWSKAMVAGATVGKPNYGKIAKSMNSTRRYRKRRRRRPRRRVLRKRED